MSAASGILSIGPVGFVLYGTDSLPVRYEDPAHRAFYESFPSITADPPASVLHVQVVRGSLPCPAGPPLFASGKNWVVWADRNGWFFGSGYGNRETPYRACRVTRSLDVATLHVEGDPSVAPLRYPLDQVLAWGLLGRCGGILLHAAAVVRDGVALVLAGRSGAGKSTLSGLCADAGWTILNDDRVMLYPDPAGAGWRVAGTPWHGSGRFARNETVPLQGVFLLEQAPRNRVETLSGPNRRLALLHAASVAWFSEEWSQAGLDALDRLARELPTRRFCFAPTRSAVDVLDREAVA